MKKTLYFFLLIITLSFTFQELDGKKFLDEKRGWQEFCIGKSIKEMSNYCNFRGKDKSGYYVFQGINYPTHFETASVKNIFFSSKDSSKIDLVLINLGVVCSADFESNTKFLDVVSKLNRIFGEVSSTNHNESLGEYFYVWKGLTTICNFGTKWDANQRHYTGFINFQPIDNIIDERNKF